ncbi:MAG: hypothetical protein DRI46_12700 [Chloroflexi bacterium]|nr:MAG: hypothetical protein DRI46_12700 [Chloroflexota bacterium]
MHKRNRSKTQQPTIQNIQGKNMKVVYIRSWSVKRPPPEKGHWYPVVFIKDVLKDKPKKQPSEHFRQNDKEKTQ